MRGLLLLSVVLCACAPVRDGTGDDDDAGLTEWELVSASANCGELRERLVTTQNGDLVTFLQTGYAEGCCPETSVAIEQSGRMLSPTYTLANDFCDCICFLDVTFTLQGLAPGAWTMEPPGLPAVEFTVAETQ